MYKYILLLIAVVVFLPACEDELEQIEPVELSFEVKDVSTFSGDDGAIDMTIKGGAPPYSIFWNNGKTTEDISNLKAGSYTVSITYGNKGIVNETVEVNQPDPEPLEVNANISNVSYYSAKDGSINLDVSGGTPPYKYQWDTGNKEDTLSFLRNLFAGQYRVTITDSSVPESIVTTKIVIIDQPEFVCGKDSVVDVDGIRYPTVKVGDQCWTSHNLRTIHKPDNRDELINDRFCQSNNCQTAKGAHYSWESAMNGATTPESEDVYVQGVCPEGWHLPSREEWDRLEDHLSSEGTGGSGTNVPKKIIGEDSPSGFDALLIGNFGYDVFSGENAVFWTTDAFFNEGQETNEAYYRMVNSSYPVVLKGHTAKEYGLSVRCIKD